MDGPLVRNSLNATYSQSQKLHYARTRCNYIMEAVRGCFRSMIWMLSNYYSCSGQSLWLVIIIGSNNKSTHGYPRVLHEKVHGYGLGWGCLWIPWVFSGFVVLGIKPVGKILVWRPDFLNGFDRRTTIEPKEQGPYSAAACSYTAAVLTFSFS